MSVIQGFTELKTKFLAIRDLLLIVFVRLNEKIGQNSGDKSGGR